MSAAHRRVLYSIAQIRAVEAAALSGLPPGTLMQRAGAAIARHAAALLTAHDGRIVVLAGPGNNGGDALDAAARLAEAGMDVTAWLVADPAALPADAAAALERARACALRLVENAEPASVDLARCDLLIDGLFGIGLARPIAGALRGLVERVNALTRPVLAIDVPSGLDAGTGNIVGPDGVAVRATHTLTFIGDKTGLHTAHGRDQCGSVAVDDLGIDAGLYPPGAAVLNSPAEFAAHLVPRLHNTHKGSFGDVVVVGGAPGMAGAPLLAARAAIHAGAGRVHVAFLDERPAADALHPELMCRPAQTTDFASATVVAGPGMGVGPAAIELMQRVLAVPQPVVLDADALNLAAAHADLRQALIHRHGATLVTPHPLEAARLLGIPVPAIQADRCAAARELSIRLQAHVVLKGSGSIVATPAGRIAINPTGNPGLATAGSGDVLAGLCGALLAQGWAIDAAARGATWMHGRAADLLVEEGVGPIGLTAGELMPAIRRVLNALINGRLR